MANSVFDIRKMNLPAGITKDQVFQHYCNLGHIRQTSDHMGIVLDI
jgi:hypothetical protein